MLVSTMTEPGQADRYGLADQLVERPTASRAAQSLGPSPPEPQPWCTTPAPTATRSEHADLVRARCDPLHLPPGAGQSAILTELTLSPAGRIEPSNACPPSRGRLSEHANYTDPVEEFVLWDAWRGMDDESDRLRVLLADQKESRLDEIAEVVVELGHTVVARLLNVADVADATRREHPDVAIVGLGEESQHALDLISELVKKAACPVIADMAIEDHEFIDNAAKRGIFAYVKHGSRSELAHALDIVLRRYAEFSRIHGALGRRALIEQAKGILMERRGISADDAFAGLRDRARNTNMTVAAVAEAVITSHPLFRTTAHPPKAPAADDIPRPAHSFP
jgi:AmiR/NasT family two-component response regulator